MKFVITGKLSKSKSELTKKIIDLGGNVVNKVDKKIAAVISNKGRLILDKWSIKNKSK